MVYFPGDALLAVSRPRGLPIGNLTSQFWANVYLDEVDQAAARDFHGLGYVRFVDDLLLFGGSKRELWQAKRALRPAFDALRLTLHPGAHPRPVSEGFPFLGFTVFPERRRLKRRKGVHFRRTLRAGVARWRVGDLPTAQLATAVQGWVNHGRYGETVPLQKALLADLPDPILDRLLPQPGAWVPGWGRSCSGGGVW